MSIDLESSSDKKAELEVKSSEKDNCESVKTEFCDSEKSESSIVIDDGASSVIEKIIDEVCHNEIKEKTVTCVESIDEKEETVNCVESIDGKEETVNCVVSDDKEKIVTHVESNDKKEKTVTCVETNDKKEKTVTCVESIDKKEKNVTCVESNDKKEKTVSCVELNDKKEKTVTCVELINDNEKTVTCVESTDKAEKIVISAESIDEKEKTAICVESINEEKQMTSPKENSSSAIDHVSEDEDKNNLDEQFLVLSDDEESEAITAHCREMNLEENEESMSIGEDESKDKKSNDDLTTKNTVDCKSLSVLDDSEDEIDSILPEFVDSEYANEKKKDENFILSDSEGEMDSAIEAFKANESLDDCLIIEDDDEDIVINDETPEVKQSKSEYVEVEDLDDELMVIEEDNKNSDSFSDEKTDIKETLEDKAKSDSTESENLNTVLHENLEKEELDSKNSCIDESSNETDSRSLNTCELKDSVKTNDSDVAVLSLINQNLDSIVSLLTESNEITTVIDKVEVDSETANLSNSFKVKENTEQCSEANEKSIEFTVKELLHYLVGSLHKQDKLEITFNEDKSKTATSKNVHNKESSESSEAIVIESDSVQDALTTEKSEIIASEVLEESLKKELLESSSSEENSLGSPTVAPLSASQNMEVLDSDDFMEVVESVEKTVKEKISAAMKDSESKVKEQSLLSSGKVNDETTALTESDSLSDFVFLNGEVSSELPIASAKNKIEGIFSACNNIAQNISLDKKDVKILKEEHSVEKIKADTDDIKKSLENCSDTADAKRKRKIEDEDNNCSLSKKLKDENSDKMENVPSFVTKYSWLDKIAQNLCVKIVTGMFTKEIEELEVSVQEREEKLNASNKDLELFRIQANDFYAAQERTFKEKNYNPKVPTRTVGVNVKIFRECDLQNLRASSAPSSGISQSPNAQSSSLLSSSSSPSTPPKVIPSEKAKLLLNSFPKTYSSADKIPSSLTKTPITSPAQPIHRATLSSSSMKGNQLRSPLVPVRIIPPNATVTRSGLPPTLNPSNPPIINHNNAMLKKSDQIADQQLATSNKKAINLPTNAAPPGTVTKLNIPSGMQPNNVLFPLSNILQFLPSNQNVTLAGNNQAQIPRHLMPPMPSSLAGQRTVGYLVNPGSGNMNAGSRGLSLPIMPNQNQRLQTIFVRVTNPNSTNPLGSVVNSVPRMQAVPQTSNSQPNSGLVLFSRTSKHPAPFPQMPTYPLHPRLKQLPPKPSLKGSKAPNGINLSWNMCLLKEHANIENYELFAYQEAAGPVTASLWKRVGQVKALPLPMACTLTQFQEGQRYYFTIRAVDSYTRFGPFSDAVTVLYTPTK